MDKDMNQDTNQLEKDLLTDLVHQWIDDGCPGDLIKVVDREILKSRDQLRKKIDLLSRDVCSDKDLIMNQTKEANKTAEEALEKMTRIENQVIPLLDGHLEELLSMEKVLKEKQENEDIIRERIKQQVLSKQELETKMQEHIHSDYTDQDIDLDMLVKSKQLIMSGDIYQDMAVGSQEDTASQEDTFKFPVCRVSKSCLAVIDLVMQALDEAEFTEDDERKKVLLKTSYNCLKLMSLTFPVKFKQEIESNSTASALLHNNLLFTAHFILSCPVTRELMEKDVKEPDLSGLMKRLRDEGEQVIKKCVQQHKTKMIDMFEDPHVLDCLLGEKPLNPFESAVKKSVLVLKKLQTCWSGILPVHVYNQMMALLMTTILDKIIELVLVVEDFSASTTDSLSLIMKSLERELSDVLQDVQLVSLIPNAFQFLELERLLSSSLTEIVCRWGSGFGPLSVAFSAVQVKKLIRSLFQNNQLRASALDKIHEF